MAVSELRQASVVLQQEATTLINEKENTNHQKSNEVTHHQFRLKAKQLELGSQNLNDQDRQRIAQEAKDLEQHINTTQREMDELNRQATDTSNSKRMQAQNLESKAAELERIAGSLYT